MAYFKDYNFKKLIQNNELIIKLRIYQKILYNLLIFSAKINKIKLL